MTLYDDLGISRLATDAEIKLAYRRRSAKSHPDRGGNPEAMSKLNQAYSVLSDPTKRLEYDQTGQTSLNSLASQAQALVLNQIIAWMVSQSEGDMVADICQKFAADAQKSREQIAEAEKVLTRLTRKLAKLKWNGEGENPFEAPILYKIDEIKQGIAASHKGLEENTLCLEILSKLSYQFNNFNPGWSTT